ncbi:MAG: D-aminoacyl-tRNA deacylase [bacterium]|nr:D-aminoacyl-tRNA deacylase [bacterium]
MRALVQRILHASVAVRDEVVGALERGLLVFAGFGHDDGAREIVWLEYAPPVAV